MISIDFTYSFTQKVSLFTFLNKYVCSFYNVLKSLGNHQFYYMFSIIQISFRNLLRDKEPWHQCRLVEVVIFCFKKNRESESRKESQILVNRQRENRLLSYYYILMYRYHVNSWWFPRFRHFARNHTKHMPELMDFRFETRKSLIST